MQPLDDETADGVSAAPRLTDERQRLFQPHLPGQPKPSVGQADRANLRALEFVSDAAEQFPDDVLERNQPDH